MIKDRIKFKVGTKPKNTNFETLTIRDQKMRADFIARVTQHGSISHLGREIKN